MSAWFLDSELSTCNTFNIVDCCAADLIIDKANKCYSIPSILFNNVVTISDC